MQLSAFSCVCNIRVATVFKLFLQSFRCLLCALLNKHYVKNGHVLCHTFNLNIYTFLFYVLSSLWDDEDASVQVNQNEITDSSE